MIRICCSSSCSKERQMVRQSHHDCIFQPEKTGDLPSDDNKGDTQKPTLVPTNTPTVSPSETPVVKPTSTPTPAPTQKPADTKPEQESKYESDLSGGTSKVRQCNHTGRRRLHTRRILLLRRIRKGNHLLQQDYCNERTGLCNDRIQQSVLRICKKQTEINTWQMSAAEAASSPFRLS